ncbi:MAG: RNA polymerase sigma factor [Bacteroidota bacterium]
METEKQSVALAVNDEEVVGRVLAGEKTAYELIMRKYNQRLFRIVRSYIVDKDEIEDVIQDAYVKAYEAMPRFEKRSSFSTWLIRITINEALARVKQHKRRPHQLSDGSESAEQLVQASNKENPLGTLMNSELKDILEKAVDGLPEKYRSVFLMREIEGMSIVETSESLAISQTNVKVRLNRAKEMLREAIGSFYHDPEVFHFDLVRCDRIVQNVLRRVS